MWYLGAWMTKDWDWLWFIFVVVLYWLFVRPDRRH